MGSSPGFIERTHELLTDPDRLHAETIGMPEYERAEEPVLPIAIEPVFRVTADRDDDGDTEKDFREDADQAVDHALVGEDDVDLSPRAGDQGECLNDVGGKAKAAPLDAAPSNDGASSQAGELGWNRGGSRGTGHAVARGEWTCGDAVP